MALREFHILKVIDKVLLNLRVYSELAPESLPLTMIAPSYFLVLSTR